MYARFPSGRRFQAEWRQPRAFERYYELLDGLSLVGTLSWEGIFSDRARAETAHKAWTIEARGILDQRVEVREAKSDVPVAVYYPKLMGNGVLDFVDGRELEWEPTNFWATNWSFFAPAGEAVVSFAEGVSDGSWKDIFKMQFTVDVDRAAGVADEAALLVMLGLYLIILRHQQVAGATAATTAAVM